MKTLMLVMMFTLVVSFAHAGGGYKCKVITANDLTDKGKLSENEYNSIHKIYIGKEFVVDRGTGRMIGDVSNYSDWGKTEVIDYGSSEQSYKAITTAKLIKPLVGTNLSYLNIEEFRKSKVKSFMFVDGSFVVTGTCVAF